VESPAIKIVGAVGAILGVADTGKHGPVRQLFFIQTQQLESRFDDGQLVVVVVDGEAPREARTNLRERVAITAQQPDAEGVKGKESRR